VDKHGKDQVLVWRRSYDIPPPEIEDLASEFNPRNDPMYEGVDKDEVGFFSTCHLITLRSYFLIHFECTL